MRIKKVFKIGIALVACVLALLLVYEAGFISVVWAKKGKPREYRTEYGYAMLRDGDDDVIKSDGGGQYEDCTLGGEDLVEIDIYNDDNSLRRIHAVLGKMTYHHPEYLPSNRRVNFWFDIHRELAFTGNAVYDILRWYREGSAYTERVSTGFLNDNTVHPSIHIYTTGKGKVQFGVDPGHNGTNPKAITQTVVDAFYDDDENVDYWDNSEYGEAGLIIYTLYYGDNGFDVVPIDWEGDKPVTWIATTKSLEPVKLGVDRYGKRGKGAHKVVYLSEYSVVPFQLTVSLNGFTQLAPRKHNTLSTSWGELKTR